MEKNLRCEICNIDVHRASYAKHLKSKRHLENIRQNDLNITECLFKEEHTPIKNKIKNIYINLKH